MKIEIRTLMMIAAAIAVASSASVADSDAIFSGFLYDGEVLSRVACYLP